MQNQDDMGRAINSVRCEGSAEELGLELWRMEGASDCKGGETDGHGG